MLQATTSTESVVEHRAADASHHGPEDWEVIDRELRRIATRRAALDVEEASWIRNADRCAIWGQLGYGSMLDYLEHVLGYGPRAASDRLRVAWALERLTDTASALSTGQLSYSAVRELARVATPETEAAWLEAASGKSLRDIEQLVTGHKPGDMPSDPANPHLGLHVVRFEVSAETLAALREARAALEAECGERLDDDALIHSLCERALGDAPSVARHQIAITVCEQCGRGQQDASGTTVDLSSAALELARCDAQYIGPVRADRASRAVRDVPPSVRRLVWHRDHGRCTIPGCRAARHLHVHHIRPRSSGGSNEPANLVLLCSAHHRACHAGTLQLSALVREPEGAGSRRKNEARNRGTRGVTPEHKRAIRRPAHVGATEGGAAAHGSAGSEQ